MGNNREETVSKYLELKSQIEALTAQLEATREEELESQVADMKKRIAAFGIQPDQLFSREQLYGAPMRSTVKPPKRNSRPPKYAYNGHSWSGMGKEPRWLVDALQSGKSREDMLLKPA